MQNIELEQNFEIIINDSDLKPKNIEMIWVPPGEFVMGLESHYDEEFTAEITEGFWLSKYPITIGQWFSLKEEKPNSEYFQLKQNYPGTTDWGRAFIFHDKMNKKMANALPKSYCFGLITEVQWEYVHRMGGKATPLKNLTEGEYETIGYDTRYKVREVGQKQPHPWGFHDMFGHYMEWCFDVFIEYPTLGQDFGLSTKNDIYKDWCGNLLLKEVIKKRKGIDIDKTKDYQINEDLERYFEQRTSRWGGVLSDRAYLMWSEPAMFRLCLRKKQVFDNSDILIQQIKSNILDLEDGLIQLSDHEESNDQKEESPKKYSWWKRIFK